MKLRAQIIFNWLLWNVILLSICNAAILEPYIQAIMLPQKFISAYGYFTSKGNALPAFDAETVCKEIFTTTLSQQLEGIYDSNGKAKRIDKRIHIHEEQSFEKRIAMISCPTDNGDKTLLFGYANNTVYIAELAAGTTRTYALNHLIYLDPEVNFHSNTVNQNFVAAYNSSTDDISNNPLQKLSLQMGKVLCLQIFKTAYYQDTYPSHLSGLTDANDGKLSTNGTEMILEIYIPDTEVLPYKLYIVQCIYDKLKVFITHGMSEIDSVYALEGFHPRMQPSVLTFQTHITRIASLNHLELL